MYHVVHIGIAESRVDHAPRLRLVVAIGIGEEDEFRSAANVGPTLHRHDRMWHGESLGKHGVLVGHAVVVEVLEYDDAVIGLVSRLDVRVGGGSRHPSPSTGIPVEIDWVLDHGIGGEEVQLESLGHGDCLELCDRVGIGDVFRYLVVWVIARSAPPLRDPQLVALDPGYSNLGDDLLLARNQFVKVFHFLG